MLFLEPKTELPISVKPSPTPPQCNLLHPSVHPAVAVLNTTQIFATKSSPPEVSQVVIDTPGPPIAPVDETSLSVACEVPVEDALIALWRREGQKDLENLKLSK